MAGMYGISNIIDEMIDNRVFKRGTVDAVLQDSSLKLVPQNIDNFYFCDDYARYIDINKLKDKRSELFRLAERITSGVYSDEQKLDRILNYTATLSKNFPLENQNNEKIYKTPKEYFWGGTEELLIFKGSDWCAEVARVFCALCQCSNIPARIIYTFSRVDGHIINEAFIEGRWILVDSTNGFIYRHEEEYASLEKMVFDKNYRIESLKTYTQKYYYSKPCYFEHVFISFYWVSEYEKYNYEISFCNEYYEAKLLSVWNADGE